MKVIHLTLTMGVIATPALAGGGYNPNNYNAYKQMQRDMERPFVTPPGPSRHFNYRDEDGFNHNCRQHGDTIDCQD